MQCIYKLMGYISEDESFDAGYYASQKRRRYSVTFLYENGFVDLEDPDYIKRCKKQETVLTLNYQVLPTRIPEERRDQFINTMKLWSRLTYAIIFAIRRKIAYDKEIRWNTLNDRVNIMRAEGDDYDDDDLDTNAQLHDNSKLV